MNTARYVKTKIVCTVGPSTRDVETLKGITEAGMDVARINSGHNSIQDVRDYIEALGRVDAASDRRIGIMLDLQGPRLRTGPIQGSGVELEAGREFTLTTEDTAGNSERVSVRYPGLTRDLSPGDSVLIDDGLIRLEVREIAPPEIRCEVVVGGVLREGKGMNFPGVPLDLPSFTRQDREYLEAGLEAGIDWISQSFVRSGEDVRGLRGAIDDRGFSTPIMAKIEMEEAVRNIDSILEESQGIMVARGDLGVEMPTEEVPLVQKEVISKALRAGKPVVTATQMLESMVIRPRPTRAEASDIANAILDGTDALMLSAETAIGAFPVAAVEVMRRIAARVEREIDYSRILEERGRWTHRGAADAIGYAACKVASDLRAKAIVTITRSGYTATTIARYRPRAEILAVSPNEEVIDIMTVVWGVKGVVSPIEDDLKGTLVKAARACKEAGFVDSGDLLVITSGFMDEEVGTTNTINLRTVE